MSGGPSFDVSREERNGAVIVTIDGEVDLTNADALQLAVEQPDARLVVLDLTGVQYIDSSGIRAIEHGFRLLQAEQRSLRIVSPPDSPAGWTFRVAGFDPRLVVETVDEALAAASDATA